MDCIKKIQISIVYVHKKMYFSNSRPLITDKLHIQYSLF